MKKLALVTVADDSFVSGTITLIYSFAKQHPGKHHDVIVIDAGLSDYNKKVLSLLAGVRLKKVSEELVESVTKLTENFSDLKNGKALRFYSLDLFSLTGYQKILFCDSDLCFIANIEEGVLAQNKPFIACSDYCNYKGYAYDTTTFKILKSKGAQGLNTSFNAGLMYIDQSQVNPENTREIFRCLSPSFWGKINSPYTDQVVFNRIFKNHHSRMPIGYNYLLSRRPELQSLTGVMASHSRVLHFNGPKPWQFSRAQARMMEDPPMVPLFKIWQDLYMESMQYLSIKQKINYE